MVTVRGRHQEGKTGAHWGLVPALGALARDGQIEAYCLPQGVISHLYRETAAGRPGLITRVGLGTVVDPRLEGGRMNAASTEEVVRVMDLEGEEFLFYSVPPHRPGVRARQDRRRAGKRDDGLTQAG
jgi:propionate CoA-transferase